MINNSNTTQLILKNQIKTLSIESGSKQSALRDLLTDIRHIAKDLKLDFNFAIEGSSEVFTSEIFETGRKNI